MTTSGDSSEMLRTVLDFALRVVDTVTRNALGTTREIQSVTTGTGYPTGEKQAAEKDQPKRRDPMPAFVSTVVDFEPEPKSCASDIPDHPKWSFRPVAPTITEHADGNEYDPLPNVLELPSAEDLRYVDHLSKASIGRVDSETVTMHVDHYWDLIAIRDRYVMEKSAEARVPSDGGHFNVTKVTGSGATSVDGPESPKFIYQAKDDENSAWSTITCADMIGDISKTLGIGTTDPSVAPQSLPQPHNDTTTEPKGWPVPTMQEQIKDNGPEAVAKELPDDYPF